MDNKVDGIAPKNLDGSTVVNTVHTANTAAVEAEKEKQQDYYVDPLEQEERMKEKLALMNSDKAKTDAANEEEDQKYFDPSSIRPDMNVSGYFSAGTTAKKTSFIKTPASADTLTLGMIVGVVGAIFSAFYLVYLIASGFSIHYIVNWIYIVVVILLAVTVFNAIRSIKVKNNSIKQKAIISIITAVISLAPAIGWLVHYIITIV